MKTLKLTSIAVCCALFAQVTHAGLFDDDEARTRIESLRKELNARMQKLEDASVAQLQLNTQIEQLKDDVAKIRGQVELLGNEIDQTQKRQKDFYVDLDTRLRKIESGSGTATNNTADSNSDASDAPSNPPTTDTNKERRDYDAAVNLLRSGKYADAGLAFKNFIKNYPQSKSLPGAHFWVASSYFQLRDIPTAQDYYGKVVNNWPNDSLAPDALLGIANCQQARNDSKTSRSTLEALVAKYPTSEAARTARQRLGTK